MSTPVALWRILVGRPDTVLCVEPTLFSAPIALLVAKLIGARTVLHVQDLEIDAAFAVGHLREGVLSKAARWFEGIVLRRFDAVVTISNRMRDCLEAKGVAAGRLSVVRNWVDLEKIGPMPGRSPFRDELGVSDDDFVVLYSGNIGPKQALSVLLEAATQLVPDRRIVFVIAGEGPEKQKLLDAYGDLPNVRFLPLQPEERLCELLNFADLHVLPQQTGTSDLVLPSKLGGMLASGKSCVVMADPSTEMHDFLLGAAKLVPTGDANELCDAIKLEREGKSPTSIERRRELAEGLSIHTSLAALSGVMAKRKLE